MRTPLLCLIFFAFSTAAIAATSPMVTADGVGALKIGMPLESLSKTFGKKLTYHVYTSTGKPTQSKHAIAKAAEECLTGSVGKSGLTILLEKQELARIYVESTHYATDKGITVGSPVANVLKAYGKTLEVSPHKYVEKGSYMLLANPDTDHGILFETDGKKVTSISAGTSQALMLVESCS